MGAIQIRRGIPNLATAEKTKKSQNPKHKNKTEGLYMSSWKRCSESMTTYHLPASVAVCAISIKAYDF